MQLFLAHILLNHVLESKPHNHWLTKLALGGIISLFWHLCLNWYKQMPVPISPGKVNRADLVKS